jgi:hypothetical protein
MPTWSRVREILITVQPVKKFWDFYGTLTFISMVVRDHH